MLRETLLNLWCFSSPTLKLLVRSVMATLSPPKTLISLQLLDLCILPLSLIYISHNWLCSCNCLERLWLNLSYTGQSLCELADPGGPTGSAPGLPLQPAQCSAFCRDSSRVTVSSLDSFHLHTSGEPEGCD
jgi:hypothetical protein